MALASAAGTVRGAYAKGVRPDPIMTVSEWSDAHRVVPSEVSAHPGKWRTTLVPFAREIMDCLSPSHPASSVTMAKSAQVVGSEIAMNFLGFIVDKSPGATLVVHPTVDAGKSWSREKLTPSIEATQPLRLKVVEQKSREGGGSTALYKRFPGGFMVITGANSTAALRQKSIRFLIKDDWSDWPTDIDGQGDPDKMADARQKSYERSGQGKKFQVSTPTILGMCRVTIAYEKSDQRRYYVKCPQCAHEQILRFFPVSNDTFRGGLKITSREPVRTIYVCEANGCVIEHHHKDEMLANGRWIAEAPGPGRQPGFHLNALYSPFETWDAVMVRFLEAKDAPRLLKTFYNLDLGLAWEERGEAPEWEVLLKRREDYALGSIPPGGLILTGFVDVQKDGLYYEVVAWGPGKTSWVVDAGFLPGDTGDEAAACWRDLTEKVYEHRWPDAYGNAWPVDEFGVDSGYNAVAVRAWVRRHPKAIATKGVPGWTAPPLGTPMRMEVRRSGKKKRYGMRAWPIGTWSLKAEFYAYLRKPPPSDGAEAFPPGFCHFSRDLDENYFRQITAESLAQKDRKDGRVEHYWKQSGENHFHDCRIGNMALTERHGITHWRTEQWAKVAAERSAPPPSEQPDLGQIWNAPPGAATAPKSDNPPPGKPAGSAASKLV